MLVVKVGHYGSMLCASWYPCAKFWACSSAKGSAGTKLALGVKNVNHQNRRLGIPEVCSGPPARVAVVAGLYLRCAA